MISAWDQLDEAREEIRILRAALVEIARTRPDGGKPLLTRRDMQQRARVVLASFGVSWS